MMRIGSGEHTYEWIEGWGKVPESESARTGWAHPGAAASKSGQVISFHPGDPVVLVFSPDGDVVRSWTSPGRGDGHGITLVEEDGQEYLWIADNGAKRAPGAGYEYEAVVHGPSVTRTDLDGRIVATLERPDLPVYAPGTFSPTSVAVDAPRFGGSGDVWVADGYGKYLVHRYDRGGRYLGSIDGEDGAGAFKQPHAVHVDRRRGEPELYVADRGNRRIQVYDLEGRFKRVVGADFLSSPSAFAAAGDVLVVAELRARLALLDPHDRLICYLGENEQVCDEPGWPNSLDESGKRVRSRRLEPGKFNSPHGVAADAAGNIYVAEWLVGGRYTRLARL